MRPLRLRLGSPSAASPSPLRTGAEPPRSRRRSPLAACGLLILLSSTAGAQKLAVETFTVGDGLPSATIYDLDQDPSGRLWILSRAGVAVYDGRTFAAAPGGLPDELLAALEIDAVGGVWTVDRLATQLYRLTAATWRLLPPLPEGRFHGATSLAVEADGSSAVVGTAAGGLLIWDGETWSVLDTRHGLPADGVNDLAVFGGRIAVGTEAGLCLLDGGKLDATVRRVDPRLRETIFALRAADPPEGVSDPAAARLWILAAEWMGYLEDDRLTVLVRGLDLVKTGGRAVGDLVVDRAGGVYFGSTSFLYFLDPVEGGHRLLERRHGPVSEGVRALLEDRESNVWIGSARGLTKVSSQRFLSFDHSQGLLEDEVSAIVEPLPGRYVLGHDTGLTFLDGEGPVPVPLPQPASGSNPRVLDLAVDARGEVWAAVQHLGLLRLAADRTWTVALPSPGVFSVEVDSRGTLWVANGSALHVRRRSGFSIVDTGLGSQEIGFLRRLVAASGERLYVATGRGLLWREGGTWRRARGPTDEASNVYNVLVEPSGEVWAGTAAGLYRLRDRQLVEVGGEAAIDRPVYLTFRDPKGRLWFGTDDGVRVWDGRHLRHLTARHGLAGRETNRGAGLVDHRDRVWIGTDQGVSLYREIYDTAPAVAPGIELRDLVAGDRRWSPKADVRLSHSWRNLTFHYNTISFSREADVLYRYRLDGFDREWQGPAALAGDEVRYTNVPPGRYRLRIAAGWENGPWSDEAISGAIVIARPLWRQPWFYALAAAAAGLVVFGAHGLRVRAIRARARALETLNAELEAQIEERRRADRARRQAEEDRERLIADLEAKNFELERFTYTVSHDLKSPLVTIRGFLGYLEQDAANLAMGRGDEARLRRDVEAIGSAAERMGRLIDDLLELSRIGRLVNPPQEVALAELVREAVEMLAGQIAEAGVEVEIAPDLPAVFGDRVRLSEVLQNLLDNAVRYMGDQESPRIEIGARADGAKPVFFVRDNGIGIDPRYHDKVFGLFERLESASEGTGIGLALSRRIVEVHGGRIWVESEGAGRGSTFCFTLPRDRATPAATRRGEGAV